MWQAIASLQVEDRGPQMPLARITAQKSEEAAQVSDRLRALGYEVEILAPGEVSNHAADLEFEVETCALEEALGRADAFARTHPDAMISVATGVLPPLPGQRSPIASALASISEGLEGTQMHIAQFWREHFERAMERQATWAETRSQSTPEEIQRREAEQRARAEALRQKREQERREQAARAAAEARQAEEERRRQAQEAERRRKERETEVARRNREAEAEVLQMAVQTSHWDEVGEKETVPSSAPIQPTEPAPLPTGEPVPAILPAIPPQAAPAIPNASCRPAPAVTRVSPRIREWRFAVVAAVVVAIGLMIGWAAANGPRPAALSNIRANGLEQQVPFGPVTLRAVPARAATAPQPIVAPKPAVQAAKPSAAVRAGTPMNKKPSPGVSRRSSDNEPEVVVRRFRPLPHPAHTGQQAKAIPRRVSDL